MGLELGQRRGEGVELADQASQLHAHGLLDRCGLAHVLATQQLTQQLSLGLDAALPAGLT
jgi:hypothetical protein